LLEINGEWHDRQRIAGIADPNSGGNTVFVSPGLRLTVDNWSSYVLVGIPVVNNYNGVQATPTWHVLAGVSAVFGPCPATVQAGRPSCATESYALCSRSPRHFAPTLPLLTGFS
jgi:hypothetical protein